MRASNIVEVFFLFTFCCWDQKFKYQVCSVLCSRGLGRNM